MKNLTFLVVLYFCFLATSLVAQDSTYKSSLNVFKGHAGEITFDAMYEPGLKLPISKKDFSYFLKKKGLVSEIYSVRGKGFFPLPDLISGVKVSDFSLIYDIWDPSLQTRRRAVHFFAYVDNDGMIVYIENHFQYSEPE